MSASIHAVCLVCDTTYSTEEDLLAHPKVEHKFLCVHSKAGKPQAFASRDSLLCHLKTSQKHTGKAKDVKSNAGLQNNFQRNTVAAPAPALKNENESLDDLIRHAQSQPSAVRDPLSVAHQLPLGDAVEATACANSGPWTIIPPLRHWYAKIALETCVHDEKTLQKFGYSTSSSRGTMKAPDTVNSPRKRSAVVLDCEMIETRDNSNELIRLSAVDYLTNEVLIDTLVSQSSEVVDWRVRYTGINQQDLREAIAAGKSLHGYDTARAELCKYVDANTILVGQAMYNDLNALRLTHTKIVDSAILMSEALGCGRNHPGLKALCSELLHVPFRQGYRAIHDSVEDCFAAREVVLRFIARDSGFTSWVATRKAAAEEERVQREVNKKLRRAEARTRLQEHLQLQVEQRREKKRKREDDAETEPSKQAHKRVAFARTGDFEDDVSPNMVHKSCTVP